MKFNFSDYFEIVEPDQTFTPKSVISVIDNHDPQNELPLVHHPLIISQSYSIDHLEIKYSIDEAINAFKKQLKDKNPKDYHFLPEPLSFDYCYTKINGFPVRVMLTFNVYHGCFVLTLDTIGKVNNGNH